MLMQDKIETMLAESIKNNSISVGIKNLLKLIISEFQRRPNLNVKLTDDNVYSIINKFIKNNDELLKYVKTEEEKIKIESENQFLSTFLPKQASKIEIFEFLKTQEINEKNKNKFIGVTIKHFKDLGMLADGSMIKSAIDEVI